MNHLDVFENLREEKDYAKAIELIPYAKFLGITFEEINEQLVFTLPFSESNIGNTHIPALHGGAIGGFMENAAILHLMWTQASMGTPRNIDFTIDYILSGRPEATYARCEVARLGKRIANVQIEAWQSDSSKPIAIARSHFKLLTRISHQLAS